MKTVAYIRRRPLQIFTRRLTTNNESADVALGNAVVSVSEVVNTLRPETIYIIFKMSVPGAQKTNSFCINAVMLYTKSSSIFGRVVALLL
jgi:hypothetical protein